MKNISTTKVRPVKATATRKRIRRRLRWNHDAGPWGNGFDHGWKDAHRGVDFGGTVSDRSPVARDPKARRLYAAAYREAQSVVSGGPQVRKLEGGTT